MSPSRRAILGVAPALGLGTVLGARSAAAASAQQIHSAAEQALHRLYAEQPKTRELAKRAVAILVFPRIYKGGLIVGGQSGDGVLLVGGRADGYYNLSAASFGLQAGGQTFSYALFFMNDGALKYLRDSDGWSVGSGPSFVVADKGTAASLTSTTLTQDVVAVPFGQRGLMAGIGLEGSKITHIHPK